MQCQRRECPNTAMAEGRTLLGIYDCVLCLECTVDWDLLLTGHPLWQEYLAFLTWRTQLQEDARQLAQQFLRTPREEEPAWTDA